MSAYCKKCCFKHARPVGKKCKGLAALFGDDDSFDETATPPHPPLPPLLSHPRCPRQHTHWRLPHRPGPALDLEYTPLTSRCPRPWEHAETGLSANTRPWPPAYSCHQAPAHPRSRDERPTTRTRSINRRHETRTVSRPRARPPPFCMAQPAKPHSTTVPRCRRMYHQPQVNRRTRYTFQARGRRGSIWGRSRS